MEHLPTLADPETDTSFIWADVAAPHRAFGVHADPVAGDVRPHPPVRQGPIGCDVEGREPTSERLGHDERGVVRRHNHAVRECQAVGDLAGLAVRRHQRDLPRRLPAPDDVVEVREVEVDRVDIDVAAAVDGHLAPAVWRDGAQLGVPDTGSVGLHPHQLGAGDEHASVREPVRRPAAPTAAFCHDLGVPLEVDSDHFVGSPVGEPQAAVMPSRRLPHPQTAQQDPRLPDRRLVRHHSPLPATDP